MNANENTIFTKLRILFLLLLELFMAVKL